MYDRESYREKLKAYKRKARKDIKKMCHLEFKKTSDELLSTAHQLMQDYTNFEDVSSIIFFSKKYKLFHPYPSRYFPKIQTFPSTRHCPALLSSCSAIAETATTTTKTLAWRTSWTPYTQNFSQTLWNYSNLLVLSKKWERTIEPRLQPVWTILRMGIAHYCRRKHRHLLFHQARLLRIY